MKKSCLVILVCIILGFCVYACNAISENNEKTAWDEQMQQDPSTWNDEQSDRYNGFMDWLDNN